MILFQYPSWNWKRADKYWFENRPLGINKLGNMMSKISTEAGLSHRYTNHSLRTTAITLWSEAGIGNHHIMAISGHRNEQSLRNYNSRPSQFQLQQCSGILSTALGGSAASVQTSTNQFLQQHQHQMISMGFGGDRAANYSGLFSSCNVQNVQISFPSPHQ